MITPLATTILSICVVVRTQGEPGQAEHVHSKALPGLVSTHTKTVALMLRQAGPLYQITPSQNVKGFTSQAFALDHWIVCSYRRN